jgi:hypothetical protein
MPPAWPAQRLDNGAPQAYATECSPAAPGWVSCQAITAEGGGAAKPINLSKQERAR